MNPLTGHTMTSGELGIGKTPLPGGTVNADRSSRAPGGSDLQLVPPVTDLPDWKAVLRCNLTVRLVPWEFPRRLGRDLAFSSEVVWKHFYVRAKIPLDVIVSRGNVVAMRIATFDEVKSLEKGQPITGISGTIAFVGKCETKDGNYGPYSSQRIALKMPGGELSVNLMNQDTVDLSAKNRKVWIVQGQDKKGQWTGLKADHYEMNQGERAGQIRYGATANANAVIHWAEPGTSAPAQGAPAATTGQPAPAPAAQRAATQAQRPVGTMDLRGVKLAAARDMIALDVCIKAALLVVGRNSEAIGAICGEGPTPRDVIAIATTLMIQGQREARFTGLGTNWEAYTQGPGQPAAAPAPQNNPPPRKDPPAPFQQEHLPSDNDGGLPPEDTDDQVPF